MCLWLLNVPLFFELLGNRGSLVDLSKTIGKKTCCPLTLRSISGGPGPAEKSQGAWALQSRPAGGANEVLYVVEDWTKTKCEWGFHAGAKTLFLFLLLFSNQCSCFHALVWASLCVIRASSSLTSSEVKIEPFETLMGSRLYCRSLNYNLRKHCVAKVIHFARHQHHCKLHCCSLRRFIHIGAPCW